MTEYDYDGAARLLAETADGTTTSFEYDVLDNLIGMDGEVQEFGASGRTTRLAGPNAILEGAGGRTFAYDKAGNALAMTSGGGSPGPPSPSSLSSQASRSAAACGTAIEWSVS